jgi:hypothetical protein
VLSSRQVILKDLGANSDFTYMPHEFAELPDVGYINFHVVRKE